MNREQARAEVRAARRQVKRRATMTKVQLAATDRGRQRTALAAQGRRETAENTGRLLGRVGIVEPVAGILRPDAVKRVPVGEILKRIGERE